MLDYTWDLRYPRPAALGYEYSIAAVWDQHTPLDPRGHVAPTALADRGRPSYASVAGGLASLATAVQSADVAPTAGERAVLAEYERELAGLDARRTLHLGGRR